MLVDHTIVLDRIPVGLGRIPVVLHECQHLGQSGHIVEPIVHVGDCYHESVHNLDPVRQPRC